MEKIKLPHRFVLLNHLQSAKGELIDEPVLQKLTTLAAIAEAYLAEKIGFDNEKLIHKDTTLTGHSIIDNITKEIEDSHESHNLIFWCSELSDKLQPYQHVRDNLLENKILTYSTKKVLGIVPAKKILVPYNKSVLHTINNYLRTLHEKQNLNLRDFLTLYLMNRINSLKKTDENHGDSAIIQTMRDKALFDNFANANDEILNK